MIVLEAKNLEALSGKINKWLQLGYTMYSVELKVVETSDKPYKAIINAANTYNRYEQMETLTDLRTFYDLHITDFCKKVGITRSAHQNLAVASEKSLRYYAMKISKSFEIDVDIARDLIDNEIINRGREIA